MGALIFILLAVVGVLALCALFPIIPIFVVTAIAIYVIVYGIAWVLGAIVTWLHHGSLSSTFEERQRDLERAKEQPQRRPWWHGGLYDRLNELDKVK